MEAENYHFKVELEFEVIGDPLQKNHMDMLKEELPRLCEQLFGKGLQNFESRLKEAKPIGKIIFD